MVRSYKFSLFVEFQDRGAGIQKKQPVCECPERSCWIIPSRLHVHEREDALILKTLIQMVPNWNLEHALWQT